jgi:hypothetical protein
MQTCVPPQSLATWSAVLLCGAIALGVEALALLFTLRPVRGGSWGGLALRGALFAGAFAVAAWSLMVRASAQVIYEHYLVVFEGDFSHPPNWIACAMSATTPLFRQDMQAVVAPVEHAAAIASGAAAALLIMGAYLLVRWVRQRWRAFPHSTTGMESDDWNAERIV